MTLRYQVKIIGHQTLSNGKISYHININDQNLNKTNIIKYRYSKFKYIHQQLLKLTNKQDIRVNLPKFPGRKLFGSTNKSQQAIRQRQTALLHYLKELLQIDTITTLPLIKKYYIPDEIPHNDTIINQQLNMQICIDRYSLVDNIVIYYLRFRDLNSHEQWINNERYSTLRNFHKKISQYNIKNISHFPSKKIFGRTNDNPDDIEKRRVQLQKYLNQLFNSYQIMNHHQSKQIIQQFIENSKITAKKQMNQLL